MRQQVQNQKRMRGRGRKSPNPLTKVYESNGPEVKIRGTAQQVADKYITLARDAISSGDNVTGQSLLQHAEHYLRIIAAAQQAQAQNQQNRAERGERNNNGHRNDERNLDEPNNRRDHRSDRGQDQSIEATDVPPTVVEAEGRQEAPVTDLTDQAQPDMVEDVVQIASEEDAPALVATPDASEDAPVEKPKQRRPRRTKAKSVDPVEAESAPNADVADAPLSEEAPKKRRGRPRKVKAEEQDTPKEATEAAPVIDEAPTVEAAE